MSVQKFQTKNSSQKKQFICQGSISADGQIRQLVCNSSPREIVSVNSQSLNVTTGKKKDHSNEKPMMKPYDSNGWETRALVTIGESGNTKFKFNTENFGYEPIGVCDGLGAVKLDKNTIRVYMNHEMNSGYGTPYTLKNGTQLTGARVSAWDMKKCLKVESLKVESGKVAYHTIIDREGVEVTDPSQIDKGRESSVYWANELGVPSNYSSGFTRFCSGGHVNAGEFGFSNTVYLAIEELSQGHTIAIDACEETSYIVPMLGQGWGERAAPIENFGSNKVLILIGDDDYYTDGRGPPLYLYVGEIGAKPPVGAVYNPPEFLVRNGLGYGKMFVWVSNDGYINGFDFQGTNNVAQGKFVAINHYDPSQEGVAPFDNLGFLPNADLYQSLVSEDIEGTMNQAAIDAGAFNFIRVEDIHPNPKDPSEAVFATTGDLTDPTPYGRVYTIKLDSSVADELQKKIEDITELSASLRILHDPLDGGGGQVALPDDAIRSPDNLTWAYDGLIYVQEDLISSSQCSGNGIQNSVWCIDPVTAGIERILIVDRSAVPKDQIDTNPARCDAWESSGILDVSQLVSSCNNRTILLLDVQAHSINSPKPPFDSFNLREGGQLLMAVGPIHKSDNLEDECCLKSVKKIAIRNVEQEQPSFLKNKTITKMSYEERIRIKISHFIKDKEKCDTLVTACCAELKKLNLNKN